MGRSTLASIVGRAVVALVVLSVFCECKEQDTEHQQSRLRPGLVPGTWPSPEADVDFANLEEFTSALEHAAESDPVSLMMFGALTFEHGLTQPQGLPPSLTVLSADRFVEIKPGHFREMTRDGRLRGGVYPATKYSVWDVELIDIHNLHETVSGMPLVSLSPPCWDTSEHEECFPDVLLTRAHITLSYMAQVYTFYQTSKMAMDKAGSATEAIPGPNVHLPLALAQPLAEVAQRLGRLEPEGAREGVMAGTFSWADMFTNNVIGPASTLESYTQAVKFMGSECERVFVGITVEQSVLFGKVYRGMTDVLKIIQHSSVQRPFHYHREELPVLGRIMRGMSDVLISMREVFDKMNDGNCDPVEWWNEVGVWAQAVPPNKGPNGLQFVPALAMDAFLQRRERSSDLGQGQDPNLAMLQPTHRSFIRLLRREARLPEYVMQLRDILSDRSGPLMEEDRAAMDKVVTEFNGLVEEHERWLKKHMSKAMYYVAEGTSKGHPRGTSGGSLPGTGRRDVDHSGGGNILLKQEDVGMLRRLQIATVQEAADRMGHFANYEVVVAGGGGAASAFDTTTPPSGVAAFDTMAPAGGGVMYGSTDALRGESSVFGSAARCGHTRLSDAAQMISALLYRSLQERRLCALPRLVPIDFDAIETNLPGVLRVDFKLPHSYQFDLLEVRGSSVARVMPRPDSTELSSALGALTLRNWARDFVDSEEAVEWRLAQKIRLQMGGMSVEDSSRITEADIVDLVNFRPVDEYALERLAETLPCQNPPYNTNMDWSDIIQSLDGDCLSRLRLSKVAVPFRPRPFSITSTNKDERTFRAYIHKIGYELNGHRKQGIVSGALGAGMGTMFLDHQKPVRRGPLLRVLETEQRLFRLELDDDEASSDAWYEEGGAMRHAVMFGTGTTWPIMSTFLREVSNYCDNARYPMKVLLLVLAGNLKNIVELELLHRLRASECIDVVFLFSRVEDRVNPHEGAWPDSSCADLKDGLGEGSVFCRPNVNQVPRKIRGLDSFLIHEPSRERLKRTVKEYLLAQVATPRRTDGDSGTCYGPFAEPSVNPSTFSQSFTRYFRRHHLNNLPRVMITGSIPFGHATNSLLEDVLADQFSTATHAGATVASFISMMREEGLWAQELYGGTVKAMEADKGLFCRDVESYRQSETTCFVSFQGAVYDLTLYLHSNRHPAGSGLIRQYCSQDMTDAFHIVGHPPSAIVELQAYFVARLAPESSGDVALKKLSKDTLRGRALETDLRARACQVTTLVGFGFISSSSRVDSPFDSCLGADGRGRQALSIGPFGFFLVSAGGATSSTRVVLPFSSISPAVAPIKETIRGLPCVYITFLMSAGDSTESLVFCVEEDQGSLVDTFISDTKTCVYDYARFALNHMPDGDGTTRDDVSTLVETWASAGVNALESHS